MHSAKLTAILKKCFLLVLGATGFTAIHAQDNSPYTRYGLGNPAPTGNIISRALGGLSAGFYDVQSINFVNPAAFSNIGSTTFDLAGEIDIRSLKSNLKPEKYSSTNTNISYLQFGFPIATKKMFAKNTTWGLSFGLKPVTRIGYKIADNRRLTNIDSVQYLYEGSGGINKVSLGTGIRHKNFSAGIDFGYNFGNKDNSTRTIFMNDSVVYYKSNFESKTNFHSISITAGIQYEIHNVDKLDPKKKYPTWRFGAYGTIPHNLKSTRSIINETFNYDGNGGTISIDTVDFKPDEAGKIEMPVNYGLGFTFMDKNNHWMLGMDYQSTLWSQYRFYSESEGLQNSYHIIAGAQYYPATMTTLTSKYFNFVKYRLGFYYGPSPINLGSTRNEYGLTAGAGFPLTTLQRRSREFATLNTAFEFGGIGNKKNGLIRENTMRFNFGISMNAGWFQRRKYD